MAIRSRHVHPNALFTLSRRRRRRRSNDDHQ